MKYIITIVVLAVLYFLLWHIPVNGIHFVTGEGEHTGYITAVETNGIFWKTPRMYVKTELSSSQEDTYCVEVSNEVLQQLKDASINNTKVTLTYKEFFLRGISNCNPNEDAGIVTSIK